MNAGRSSIDAVANAVAELRVRSAVKAKTKPDRGAEYGEPDHLSHHQTYHDASRRA